MALRPSPRRRGAGPSTARLLAACAPYFSVLRPSRAAPHAAYTCRPVPPLAPSPPSSWYDRLLSSLPDAPPPAGGPAPPDVGDRRVLRVSAPMVGQSGYAFRRLVRRHGCDLAYTQMIHAGNVCKAARESRKARPNAFIAQSLDVMRDEVEAAGTLDAGTLDAGGGQAPPHVVVQVAGNSPETVSEAALRILEHVSAQYPSASHPLAAVSAIDLNVGCPQKIARAGNYGAFLLHDPPLLLAILDRLVRTVHDATDGRVGVTAKIRVFDDTDATLALVRDMADTGIDALCVHGRTVRENKTATGPARWESIGRIVDEVGRGTAYNLPVFANGGIAVPADVARCAHETGADGVMSSEALLEDPALFARGERPVPPPAALLRRQAGLAREYLALAAEHPPPVGGGGAPEAAVKSHVFKMLYCALERDDFRDLRDALADHDACRTMGDIRAGTERVADRIDRLLETSGDDLGPVQGWYGRHRKYAGSGADTSALPAVTAEERKAAARARIEAMRQGRKEGRGFARSGGEGAGFEGASVA